ncbi:MAG TPA: MarR family transcriptional regulator [Ktedonobacterales bacterium]
MRAPRRDHEAYQLIKSTFLMLENADMRFLQHVSRILFAPATDITLTITRFWALVHLEPPEGRTMAELAQLLLCDKSNVTALVDKLEEHGLAMRVRGKAGDRRFTSVVLTEEGRAVRARVTQAHDEWVRMQFAELPDELLNQLVLLLTRLQSGLEIDPEAAARAALTRSDAGAAPVMAETRHVESTSYPSKR